MPALPVELLTEVVQEAQAARIWYAWRSVNAGARFMAELEHAVDQFPSIREHWPVHLHGTRRYRMANFPYLVVYQVLLDRIQVIACQHGHRRPGYWRGSIGRASLSFQGSVT